MLKCYQEHGPFDGIFGFSQGAGLGLFLAALQDKGDIATDFKFVISYSGFYPSDVSIQVGECFLYEVETAGQWLHQYRLDALHRQGGRSRGATEQ